MKILDVMSPPHATHITRRRLYNVYNPMMKADARDPDVTLADTPHLHATHKVKEAQKKMLPSLMKQGRSKLYNSLVKD